jgi:hypothetical protein
VFKVHVIKVIFNFVKASSCLFQQVSIQGYPGVLTASRLPATWVTYNLSIKKIADELNLIYLPIFINILPFWDA